MVSKVCDSYGPLGGKDIRKAVSIFGDVNSFWGVIVGDSADDLVHSFRVHFPAHVAVLSPGESYGLDRPT